MKYCISEEKLRTAYSSKGFRSIRQFAEAAGLHRNLVHDYLRGKEVFSKPFLKLIQALDCDPLDLIAQRGQVESQVNVPSSIKEIASWISNYRTSLCVILFGSRAKGGSVGRYADWDIGLFSSSGKLSSREYLRLKNKVEEMGANLPWDIDLVNFDTAPEWFFKEMGYRPVYLAGSQLAWMRLIEKWEVYHEKSETA